MGKIKNTKATLLAYLYFFFNNAGLAGGLLYTNLLTPFFYFWLLLKKKQPFLWPFFMVVLPFDLIHVYLGIEWKTFMVSNFLFLSTYIFVCCFHYYLHHQPNIGLIFKRVLVANFVFTLVACGLYFTPYKETLWYMNKFTESVRDFHRLALLTFEASYYALLFAPIALYYLLKIFLGLNQKTYWQTLLLVITPLGLSLSFGVIGSLMVAIIGLYILHFEKIFYKKHFFNWLVLSIVLLLFVTICLAVFLPNNVLFVRLYNVYYGIDTSTKGRTTDSFGIAWMVAQERSIWFGSGLGQIKILALDVVKRHYNYWGDLNLVRIPNSVAETLAIFGIFGLAIRFGIIFYLFFKTRVLSNYYRTAIFIFIFIYQFTGSYITSAVEYVLWVIAFSAVFKQFDVKKDVTPLLKQTPSE